jgi:type II secretory pathway pseudopilin PulG
MRLLAQLFGVLLVVGFVLHYIWWIVAALAVSGLVWMVAKAFREIEAQQMAEARRRAALIRRADQQHRWVLAGDESGIYGAYPPAAI